MSADALYPCITRISVTMILAVYSNQVIVSHGSQYIRHQSLVLVWQKLGRTDRLSLFIYAKLWENQCRSDKTVILNAWLHGDVFQLPVPSSVLRNVSKMQIYVVFLKKNSAWQGLTGLSSVFNWWWIGDYQTFTGLNSLISKKGDCYFKHTISKFHHFFFFRSAGVFPQ